MTSEGTERRSIRIEQELWDLAKIVAFAHGDTISTILRHALVDYLVEKGAITEADKRRFLR